MAIMPSGAALRRDLAAFVAQHARDSSKYIGNLVMPYFEVDDEANTFKKLSVDSTSRLPDDSYSTKAGANRDDFELEEDNYTTKPRAFEGQLTDPDRARFAASGMDGEAVVAGRAYDVIAAREELRVASALFNTTNFPLSGTTGATVSNAWSSSSGDPYLDIITGMRIKLTEVGSLPDTLVITAKTYLDLCRNPVITGRFTNNTERGMLLTPEQLKSLFAGIQKLYIGGMNSYNTADKGQTPTVASLWTNGYAWLGYTANGPTDNTFPTPQVGRIFAWKGWGGSIGMRQYREDKTDSDIFKVYKQTVEKLFGSRFGYLMSGV